MTYSFLIILVQYKHFSIWYTKRNYEQKTREKVRKVAIIHIDPHMKEPIPASLLAIQALTALDDDRISFLGDHD